MPGKNPITPFRLEPDLAQWAADYADGLGMSRTAVVRDLLQALRERRLVVVSEAAPHVVNDGSDPRNPVFVCHTPK